ncbi:hypothetical protein [Actinoplanes sp. NBRC 101535]|uniref:hypothetical protein n=1 Tax=Actinoplanes sp. NBRC 101535 TaxID=3032196 RepID=UPI0024A3EDC7|nr:hypothetical protein [Actinoplanes sp. NBRC 101535]GLY04476.1 hypothetical protein Acsp01_48550 [Actinoplanes sp. NBRC 101535]
MRASRLIAGTLAGVTTLTLIGACGQQIAAAVEPKLELRNAMQKLAEAEQAGFTLKVTGSADDLAAALKASGEEVSADGEDRMAMDALFASSFTISYDKAGEGTADDRGSLAATISGVTGTEIRWVDAVLYAKMPVQDVIKKVGATDADFADLRKEVTAMPGVIDFVDGDWVKVTADQLGEFAEGGFGVPTDDLESEKLTAEVTAGATNLLEGATITRDSADETHLIATSSTAKAYTEAKRLVTAVDPGLAGDLGEAPADKPITLDLWIEDGELTAAELNVLQFVDGATGRVAARLEVATGEKIEAPADAKQIDLKQFADTAGA